MNDPLVAAIVREVVRIITEKNLIAESYRKGEVFLSQLLSLVDAETITEVRGRGLMMAVDVPYPERASAIYDQLLMRGFIVSSRKTAFE
jgi:acetylornithine/succinyldiaminopimelate/putrescine aminotransferase